MAFSNFGAAVTVNAVSIPAITTKFETNATDEIAGIWLRTADEFMCGTVISFSGTTPTVEGVQTPLDVGDRWVNTGSRPAICRIDSNWFVICYQNPGDSWVYVQLWELTGGNALTWRDTKSTGFTANHMSVCATATNKFVLAVRETGGNGGRVICGTRSGAVITLGAAVATAAAATNPSFSSICKVDNHKFVVSYRHNTGIAYCICGDTPSGIDAAGRVITVGAETQLHVADIRDTAITSPDTDKFVVFYDDLTGTQGLVTMGTVSGRNITIGAEASIGASGRCYNPCVTKIGVESDWVLCVYQDNGDGDKGKVNIVYMDWDAGTIDPFTPETFTSAAVGGTADYGLSLDMVSADVCGILYQDDDDADKIKIIAGEITLLPDAPTNVVCTPGTQENVITWDAVAGATSYNIYWSFTSGVTKATGTKLTGVTSPYTHSSLLFGELYYYVVVAENAVGEGPESAEIYGAPLAPQVTGVVPVSGFKKITLSWTAIADADYYNIYWLNATGVTLSTGNLITEITTNSYEHSPLNPNKIYYYVVTCVGGTLEYEGPESTEVSATPQDKKQYRELYLSLLPRGKAWSK